MEGSDWERERETDVGRLYRKSRQRKGKLHKTLLNVRSKKRGPQTDRKIKKYKHRRDDNIVKDRNGWNILRHNCYKTEATKER